MYAPVIFIGAGNGFWAHHVATIFSARTRSRHCLYNRLPLQPDNMTSNGMWLPTPAPKIDMKFYQQQPQQQQQQQQQQPSTTHVYRLAQPMTTLASHATQMAQADQRRWF